MEMKEKQLQEALERMEILDLHENTTAEMKKEGVVNKSVGGMLFWLSEEEEKMIQGWQENTGALVYHVIPNKTDFGELLTLLYVSKHEDEWDADKADLKENVAIAYVMNLTVPEFSEYGSVGLERFMGGLKRIA